MGVSPYVLVIGVAWLAAHIIKYVVATVMGRKVDFARHLLMSGGMPSSHAATSVSVWTVVLMKDGIESGLFGLATLVTLVVCYDAVKVRRSVGEQGDAIRQMIKRQNLNIDLPRAARGHTPFEVLAGSVLGMIIGLIVTILTK